MPNLPNSNICSILVDYRIAKSSLKRLSALGIDVIFTKKNNRLHNSLCGHADMQIIHIGSNKFVCDRDCYDYYSKMLPDAQILCSDKSVDIKYPNDIILNCALVGKYAIHNFNFTDSRLLDELVGYNRISVKQGYSKCSVAVLNENTIITSDTVIHAKAIENRLNSLYVNCDDIILKGMSHGFIGGICGKIAEDKLAVNGTIEKLKCGKSFIEFCNKHSIGIIPLNDGIPEDIGSIIPLY